MVIDVGVIGIDSLGGLKILEGQQGIVDGILAALNVKRSPLYQGVHSNPRVALFVFRNNVEVLKRFRLQEKLKVEISSKKSIKNGFLKKQTILTGCFVNMKNVARMRRANLTSVIGDSSLLIICSQAGIIFLYSFSLNRAFTF